jgi:glycosyltransferase involved in cell wall biosynthesis
MRVLMAITYYKPYVSGLTVYVERLSTALVMRGHSVTVLTSQFDSALPRREERDGVTIERVPVAARVTKAVLMPGYPAVATRLLREHDVVNLHLPQPESLIIASMARSFVRRPIVLTYHCDVNLPSSPINRAIDEAAFANNWLTGRLADAIVAYTNDYAEHSRFLSRFPAKRRTIPPPVSIPLPNAAGAQSLNARLDLGEATVIGFAARFATEKGVDVLLDALPMIRAELGDVRVLFAGPYENVIGEEHYLTRLRPRLEALGRGWTFLGTLSAQELADFYSICHLTVLPSVNSTESFGMVQVEAMATGTPVCASNLPGVRVPIQSTGMGLIAPIGEPAALAAAVVEIVRNRGKYVRPRAEVEQLYSVRRTADDYVTLYESLSGASTPVASAGVSAP